MEKRACQKHAARGTATKRVGKEKVSCSLREEGKKISFEGRRLVFVYERKKITQGREKEKKRP